MVSNTNSYCNRIDRTIAILGSSSLIMFNGQWPAIESELLLADMRIIPNFVTTVEEESFMKELEPYLKRMRYEFDHWDDVTMFVYSSYTDI